MANFTRERAGLSQQLKMIPMCRTQTFRFDSSYHNHEYSEVAISAVKRNALVGARETREGGFAAEMNKDSLRSAEGDILSLLGSE